WLGGRELESLRSRATAAAKEQAAIQARLVEAETERNRLTAELEDLRNSAGRAGKALQRDTVAAADLETSAERLQRVAMVARERRMAAESRLRGAGERKSDLEQECADVEREIAAARVEEQTAVGIAERRETALSALEEEERTLSEQVQLPAESVAATMRGDLRSLEVASARDDRELAAVTKRLDLVSERLREEQNEALRLQSQIEDLDAAVGAAQRNYDASRTSREKAQQQWEVAEAARNDARLDLARASARVEAIEAALAGIGDPVAREAAASSEAIIGLLVTRLDVPLDVARAVDAALGSWSEAFVARTSEGMSDVVAELKAAGHGGVTILNGRGPWRDGPARTVAVETGMVALVDRLGSNHERLLADRLLGDVVLVPSWDRGIDLVAANENVRAVTVDGDLITADGLILASANGAGQAALEAARDAFEAAERSAARGESTHVVAKREFDTARTAERTALEALETLEAKLDGFTEALALIERTRSEGTAEVERLEERGTALGESAVARQERLIELRQRVAEFEGEEAERQAAWDALNRRRDEVAARRDEARREREAAAAGLASVAERRRLLEDRLEKARIELEDLDQHPVHPNYVAHLTTVEERARAGLDVVRTHIAALRERQRALRAEAGVADGQLESAYQVQRSLEREISDGRERASVLAIELAELRVRDESVAEGLRRDADATEEEAMAAPMPPLSEGEVARDKANELEAELRRMGPINPLAAAEYRELAEQVETLESQLGDLNESRAELQKVITALNDEMTTMFDQAFAEISALFEENFSLVFPGGKGRLTLLDPENPLTSGVEIEAQPLGKKVGRLSLLSGGERSLAALAFLFAVFRSRPSPFYVLDEVEAALDDANLRRFLRLVDTLRHSAQLIIITHQQQTMEAADVLYGVTMEPGESSKVIAKRLAEARV
ncbi:MAG: AAA family ATPase, partial [Acidimicrobiia bacterium]|nr:AAA family ATPase [Acidimicrobiia bacterium]